MNVAHLVETQWRAVVVVILLLAIGGIVGATCVPLSLFPQTDFPRIIIVVENGEVAAQQMLVTVTKPVEEAMSGIPGIARIKSVTSRGATEVDLFFDWRSNVEQTLQIVQARLSQMATTLPPTASVKRVERLTFAVFPILGYSVTSSKRDPGTLRTMAELTIRPPLARVPGVATVMVQGGEVREYHVRVDPARLDFGQALAELRTREGENENREREIKQAMHDAARARSAPLAERAQCRGRRKNQRRRRAALAAQPREQRH